MSIPDDLDNRSLPKASGTVVLPPHIAWSFPSEYDLGDRKQLRYAYERVMTEGLEDDDSTPRPTFRAACSGYTNSPEEFLSRLDRKGI